MGLTPKAHAVHPSRPINTSFKHFIPTLRKSCGKPYLLTICANCGICGNAMIDIIYRFDANYRRTRPAPKSPAEARQRLDEGNRLFAEMLEAEDKGVPHEPRVIPF